MKTHDCKCKFCGKPLAVQIDQDYNPGRDELGLLKMAACNRCAEFARKRRDVYAAIKRICERLALRLVPDDRMEETKETLETLLKRYLRVLADYRNTSVPDWDPGILEDVIEQPALFGKVLGRLPKLFNAETLL